MISFLISILALVLGYIFYGRFIERIFRPDAAKTTPACQKNDGMDYVPMPAWKVFMIQFLNIAGTGPIFGAIMGAKFGPACYLWIVLGSIFAGAVHDFYIGMLSVRSGGLSFPNIAGTQFGKGARNVMLVFSLVLLVLVGVVFVYSPALILGDIAGFMGTPKASVMIWVAIVFVYYIIATLLPVDKLIGRIYPLFAFCLLFMAVALMAGLFVKWPSIPEFWQGLGNRGPEVGLNGQSIFPCLFITVACGAISGFHSTQSPLMARCITNEKYGRPIFYGAMITEGIVALIWAAVSSYFFFDGGMAEVGAAGAQAPTVVTSVSIGWLGLFGGILAIIGMVAAPITSGDTAFRSARLILADFLGLDQKRKSNRLILALPLFVIASLLLWYNISDENGFNVIWRYFGLANQSLAAFSLWLITFRILEDHPGKAHFLISLIPAIFMTCVCVTFLCVDKICFGIDGAATPWIAGATAVASIAVFFVVSRRRKASGR